MVSDPVISIVLLIYYLWCVSWRSKYGSSSPLLKNSSNTYYIHIWVFYSVCLPHISKAKQRAKLKPFNSPGCLNVFKLVALLLPANKVGHILQPRRTLLIQVCIMMMMMTMMNVSNKYYKYTQRRKKTMNWTRVCLESMHKCFLEN